MFPQTPGLLPRIDERYWSLPHRYGFIGYGDHALPLHERAASMKGRVNNRYGRMDFATGQVSSYFVGDIARVILPFRLAPQIHGWWSAPTNFL